MINVNKIGEIYSLNGLSDGEKSIIYYIAKVLLAPKKSYIVVDEPETYLHPSIYNKLWDLLIEERKDCQFIFSSHTMDFITARNDVSIAWCKNFKYPDKFELKIIGVDTKMPTDLKIELLGNRKPVIFCEGALSSLDYQVYSSLFLDEYLVKPVGGHNKVIQYTKSYNSLEEFEDSKAFGIIDRDFHGQRRIEGLSKKNIITTKYNEIEMLLLDKRIMKAVIAEENPNEVDNKIQHFEELFYTTVDQHKNKIANQYIKKTLEDRFHNFVFQKYDKINTINNQINSFVDGIDVEVEYQLKLDEVNQIIENKEYDNLLAVCNLKKAIIPDLTTKCLNSNYLNKVIKKIKSSEELRTYIVDKYFKILVD